MFTPSGKIIYKGEEGLECSLQMIDFATRSANSDGSDDHDISELAKAISVTRLCFTDKSYQNWKSSAESYPEWIEQQVIDPAEFALDDQVDKPIASFLIKKAYAVETTKYLQSLWRTVQEKAHSFNCEVEYSKVNVKYITDIRDDPGDIVILANGAVVCLFGTNYQITKRIITRYLLIMSEAKTSCLINLLLTTT